MRHDDYLQVDPRSIFDVEYAPHKSLTVFGVQVLFSLIRLLSKDIQCSV